VDGMSRLVHRRIEVERWVDDEPHTFSDGGQRHQVAEVLDRWIEMGEWWKGEGVRKLLRVVTSEHGIYDLEYTGDEWFIYKVWD
jgi:hypothetical protein